MKDNEQRRFWKKLLPNLVLVCAGVVLFILLYNFKAVWAWMGWFAGLFAPFLYGIAIAYLLNIPMRFFEKKLYGKMRHRRVWSILTVYLLAVALLALAVMLILPEVLNSIRTLLQNIPFYLQNLRGIADWLSATFEMDPDSLDFIVVTYHDIVTQVTGFVRSSLPNLLSWTWQLSTRIISFLTSIIASVYMLASRDKLLLQMRKLFYALLPKPRADRFYHVARLSNRVFAGFISGKIIDSAIIGLICFVFMWLAGFFIPMPFALLISVIIGVTNIIPFFGPFIGAIPSTMILLMANPFSALVFVIFIILLQQLDGNVIGPKILGGTTGLPPLWVLVSIIICGGVWGLWGILLGVPAAAVLYTLASDFVAGRLRKKGIGAEELAAQPVPPAPAAEQGAEDEASQ